MSKVPINMSTGSLGGKPATEQPADIQNLADAASDANALVVASEQFITKNFGLMKAPEIALIYKHIQQLKDAIEAGDKTKMDIATQELNDANAPIAERLIKETK